MEPHRRRRTLDCIVEAPALAAKRDQLSHRNARAMTPRVAHHYSAKRHAFLGMHGSEFNDDPWESVKCVAFLFLC
jgi:hypothetical protein